MKLGKITETRDAITADVAAIRSDAQAAADSIRRAAAVGLVVFALIGLGVIVALSRSGGQR